MIEYATTKGKNLFDCCTEAWLLAVLNREQVRMTHGETLTIINATDKPAQIQSAILAKQRQPAVRQPHAD